MACTVSYSSPTSRFSNDFSSSSSSSTSSFRSFTLLVCYECVKPFLPSAGIHIASSPDVSPKKLSSYLKSTHLDSAQPRAGTGTQPTSHGAPTQNYGVEPWILISTPDAKLVVSAFGLHLGPKKKGLLSSSSSSSLVSSLSWLEISEHVTGDKMEYLQATLGTTSDKGKEYNTQGKKGGKRESFISTSSAIPPSSSSPSSRLSTSTRTSLSAEKSVGLTIDTKLLRIIGSQPKEKGRRNTLIGMLESWALFLREGRISWRDVEAKVFDRKQFVRLLKYMKYSDPYIRFWELVPEEKKHKILISLGCATPEETKRKKEDVEGSG
jgi:hypothetical protein